MILHQRLDPGAFFDHICTDGAFEQIRALADGIDGQNAKTRKAAQAEGKGHTNGPDKAAVKQECHQGLTAGAQGEIGGIGVGIEGHHYGADADQPGG